MGAALAHAQGGFLVGRHNRVAANDQIGCRHADPRGANGLLAGPNQHVAPGAAALLRQAARILRDDAQALQVRGHAQQLANGDDPRATDTRHHNAPNLGLQHRQHGLGQGAQLKGRSPFGFGFFLQLPALDGDKTGAKALGA